VERLNWSDIGPMLVHTKTGIVVLAVLEPQPKFPQGCTCSAIDLQVRIILD